jgi:hypothetical protein
MSSFTLRKEAESSSEKLVNIYQTVLRHIHKAAVFTATAVTNSNAKVRFSVSHSVQTGSGAHTAPYAMGIWKLPRG